MKTSFSNDDVQLQINKLPGCTVEYTVTCSPTLIQKAEKQAIKKIAKEVSIPGFRKGKVPEEVIRRNYLKALESETKEELTQLAFQEARKLDSTPIMQTEGSVGAKLIHFGDGKAEFQYFITTNPEVPSLENLDTIKVQSKPLKSISEKDVEKEIKNLLRLFATWNDITGRPVKEGDFVRVNGYDLSEEGEPKIFNESRLDVSKDGLSTEWLHSALIGMEIGQSKIVDTFPNAEEEEEFKKTFVKKQVRLEVTRIEEPNTPALDEAFVQKLGLPNVEELQKEMKKRLENEAMSNHLQSLKDSLSDEILKNIPLEIPSILVDREVASRMRRYLSSSQGKKEYESFSKEEQEKKRDDIRSKSEEAIRLYFIIQAIIRKYHIAPPANIQQDMTQIAQKYFKEGSTKKVAQQNVQQAQNEQNQYLASTMMDTALMYVLDKVLHALPHPTHA
jgi:trigger factor